MACVARKGTVADAAFLSARLLPADRAEVQAASGLDPFVSLRHGVENSVECWVLEREPGEPFCMWGITRTPDPDIAALWLLCGEGMEENRVAFLRTSKQFFARYEREWPLLWNLCDERNTAHIRFVQWHGCVFINRHLNVGHEQRPFLEFVRLSPCATPSASP